MTQKELLYFEDAVGHEDTIISICEDMIKNLENEELVSFMEEEVNHHRELKERLFNLLEDKNNECSIINE